MDEELKNEFLILRQAIARLSDRMESTEQKLRAMERAQRLANIPVEPSAQIKAEAQHAESKFEGPARQIPPSSHSEGAAQAYIKLPIRMPVEPKNDAISSAAAPATPKIPPVPAKPVSTVQHEKKSITDSSVSPAIKPVAKSVIPSSQIKKGPAVSAAATQDKAIRIEPKADAENHPPKSSQPIIDNNERSKNNIELNIGKYWLNKIGIGMFVLGVGFLVAYSSRYFGLLGPWGKILTGYFASALLFIVGWKFRRSEKLLNFGYVLTGGAWALTYFTTFAMHHFPQSRVVESEPAGLVLLAGVAACMLISSLKYRSEVLSGVAIFVGYVTATLGDVHYFTLISCAVEAMVILVLVYRFKWLRMMFFGIIMTYVAHFLWVTNNIHGAIGIDPLSAAKGTFLMNATFLTLYWAFFTIGIHLLAKVEDSVLGKRLAVANIANTLFYFLLLYPDITQLFPDQRFSFLLSLGAVFMLLAGFMFTSGASKLFACDAVLGIALVTFAIPIRYMPLETSLIWIAELPLLYYLGLELKSRTIRAVGFLLFLWTMLYYSLYLAGGSEYVELMGLGSIPMSAVTAFCMTLSFGVVFTLLRRAFACSTLSDSENIVSEVFPLAAIIFLCIGTFISSAPENLTLYIFLDALLVFVWGYVTNEVFIRIYSLLFLWFGLLRFTGFDVYTSADDYGIFPVSMRWVYIIFEISCSYAIYFLYSDLRQRQLLHEDESGLVTGVAISSGLMVLTAVLRYVPQNWMTFTFAALSLIVFGIAYAVKSRNLRFTALGGFTIAIVRFMFADNFPSAGFADWLIISFLPFTLMLTYLLYRKMRIDKQLLEDEYGLCDYGYALFQIALMTIAFRYVSGYAMTSAFAVMNLALFVAGCLLRERFVRWASLIFMPVVLCRFLFIDNYAPGMRTWPLVCVLGSYYMLVYAYIQAIARDILETAERPLLHLVYAAATILSAYSIWTYAPEAWVAASLALAGLVIFLYGYLSDSTDMRISGNALLLLALFRGVSFYDEQALVGAVRLLPPAVELFSFGLAYWFYRKLRLAGRLSGMESGISHWLFLGFVVIASLCITRHCPQYWVSSSLAVFSAAMFFAGCALDEPFMRVCSCAVFAIVLVRAESYYDIGRLCWIPVIVQLSALLGIYLPYRKMTSRGGLSDAETYMALAMYGVFLLLLVLYIFSYASESYLAMIFTGCYLALFACGVFCKDKPLRIAWMLLAPIIAGDLLNFMPDFQNNLGNIVHAVVVCGGMYAVYVFSKNRLKTELSQDENDFLPALCMAAGAMLLLFISSYTAESYKTMLASALLLSLYAVGVRFKDDMLAISGFVFAPYIFVQRLGYDSYDRNGFLLKWTAVLSAPAAFLGVYFTGLGKNLSALRQKAILIGMVPGLLLLFHALAVYSPVSLRTLFFGIAGLVFFVPGFYFNDKPLRYTTLLMFAVVVLRIAVVDIAGLPIIYKIISFILLGLILLGVSYIYTRFISDEPANP